MKEEVLIWMYVKCIFWYVHSTVQSNSESEEGVNYQIKVGWMKWRYLMGVLCDHKSQLNWMEISISLQFGKWRNDLAEK